MSTGNNKQKQLFKKINRRLMIIIAILAVVFFSAQVYFTSKVGTKSAEIEKIRIEKNALRLDNEILSSKIDAVTSTKSIQKLAQELGLVEKNINELSASSKNDLALNQK